jgi:hypothetical protein
MTALLVTVALSIPSPAVDQAETPAAILANGIRQVEEGDLEAAVITLDTAVQRLSAEKGKEKELALARLYLGMAHLGLSQWERAKAEMREAWRNNKDLKLDPKKFPPRVMQLYEEAKREAKEAEDRSKAESRTKPVPTPSPQPPAKTGATATSGEKKGGSKAPLVILGVVGAGAAVAAAAAAGGGSKTATPAPTVTPAACASGQFTATGIRYDPAMFACPRGAGPTVSETRYVVELANNSQAEVTILSVETENATCTTSPGFNCTHFSRPLPFVPSGVSGGGRATLLATTSFTCTNDTGRSGFIDLIATLRIVTSCGVFVLTPANPYRITFN